MSGGRGAYVFHNKAGRKYGGGKTGHFQDEHTLKVTVKDGLVPTTKTIPPDGTWRYDCKGKQNIEYKVESNIVGWP